MNDLPTKVAFLEARLTLLERRLNQLEAERASPAAPSNVGAPEPISIACNDPGLMIFRNYPIERTKDGVEFCWIGNDGPIQLVLPVRPVRPLKCRLRLQPHPAVDLSRLMIGVNDQPPTEAVVSLNENVTEVCFDAPASAAPILNVLLSGVNSVRPVDLGQNPDIRLLAARFFGAEITFS